jgi:hypothetical protein
MDQDKLRVLARPFTDIKTRPGRNGGQLQYIEGHQVVQRLNEAFGGDWSFRVMQHDVLDGEVVVLGELRAGDITKHAFGGSEVTKTREGRVVSLADDLKSAATDALKKAATLMGVGLHLYGPEETATPPPTTKRPPVRVVEDPPADEPEVPQGNRLTRKQADFIAKLARTRGMSQAEVDQVARERFGKSSAYLSVHEASDFIKQLGAAA